MVKNWDDTRVASEEGMMENENALGQGDGVWNVRIGDELSPSE